MPRKADDFIVDLTNYKDKTGTRVAEGPYHVVVEDAENDTSSKGNPMVNLWLRVQGGEYDGATLVDRLTMTEKSLFRVVNFMQAVGLPTPKKKVRVPLAAIIGKHLMVDVADGEPYNNRIKSEVQGYMRITSAQQGTTDDEDVDDLAVFTDSGDDDADDEAPAKDAEKVTVPDDGDVEEVDLDTLDLG